MPIFMTVTDFGVEHPEPAVESSTAVTEALGIRELTAPKGPRFGIRPAKATGYRRVLEHRERLFSKLCQAPTPKSGICKQIPDSSKSRIQAVADFYNNGN